MKVGGGTDGSQLHMRYAGAANGTGSSRSLALLVARGTRATGAGDTLKSHVVRSHWTEVDTAGRTQLHYLSRHLHRHHTITSTTTRITTSNRPPAAAPPNSPSRNGGGGHVRVHHRRRASAPGRLPLPCSTQVTWSGRSGLDQATGPGPTYVRTLNLVRPHRSRPSYWSPTNLRIAHITWSGRLGLDQVIGRYYGIHLFPLHRTSRLVTASGGSWQHPRLRAHTTAAHRCNRMAASEGSLGGAGSISAAPEGPDERSPDSRTPTSFALKSRLVTAPGGSFITHPRHQRPCTSYHQHTRISHAAQHQHVTDAVSNEASASASSRAIRAFRGLRARRRRPLLSQHVVTRSHQDRQVSPASHRDSRGWWVYQTNQHPREQPHKHQASIPFGKVQPASQCLAISTECSQAHIHGMAHSSTIRQPPKDLWVALVLSVLHQRDRKSARRLLDPPTSFAPE